VLYVIRDRRSWAAQSQQLGCDSNARGAPDPAPSAITGELADQGARVAGLSAQPLAAQIEFAQREHMPFPVIADPELRLRDALALPTFEFGGVTLYKRITLVLEAGRVSHVFYPVFPPDRNAGDVVAWLRARGTA
jgi:peroxiredoxin